MNRREAIKRTAIIMGGAVSAVTISGIMGGCKAEPTPTGWQPAFLSKEQYETVAEIAETILPKTGTPGAKEVGVPQFIDNMLTNYFNEANRAAFAKGLDGFIERCKQSSGKAFKDCNEEERSTVMTALERDFLLKKEAQKNDEDVLKSQPFYTTLKEMVIVGYFTSEKIGTEVLRYDPIPGTYDPCMPYQQGDRMWSLG